MCDFQKFLSNTQYPLLPQKPTTLTDFTKTQNYVICKKDITFIYTDMGEYYNLKPIADEATSRGYKVTFTNDIFTPAEIGVTVSMYATLKIQSFL